MTTTISDREDPLRVAQTVTDPELPMLTLAELGVLRDVATADDGTVLVTITPTYSGCPAFDTMRTDLRDALRLAGYSAVEVRTVLSPPWSSSWISADGRRKLADAGIRPPADEPISPGEATESRTGPIPLTLGPTVLALTCPACGSGDTTEISRFSATACKALWRCRTCSEPFEHFKAI